MLLTDIYGLLGVSFYNTSLWVLLHVFFCECTAGSNIAIYININHILYCPMGAFSVTLLGCTYFISPDYVVFQGWIRATLLSPTNTTQAI